MSVSIEVTSKLGRKMTVSIPAEEIDKKTNAELEKIKNKVKIDGFRKGKVPPAIIKQRFGDATRHQVISELIESSYFEAIKNENLRPAALPHIEPNKSSFGEPLIYVATFEVFPEIQLAEMTNEKIEKLVSEITDKDIDEALLKMRKQHATWQEVERETKDGDQLVIDFVGEIDGVAFNGGTAKDFRFELGAGSMLQDFEQGLKNVKPNQEVKFVVKFPEDYSDTSVAGKHADFTVKVHKVLESKLADLNDEFFRKSGINEGGEEALRGKIRKNLETELKNKIDAHFKKSMLNKLLELNPIEIPEAMINNETRNLQTQATQWFSYYTKTPLDKVPVIPAENFRAEAERRVKLGLLLAEVVKKHNLKVDADMLRQKIDAIASTYEKPEHIVKWYYKDKKHLTEVESSILEELAVEKLQNQLGIVEKKVDYKELVDKQEQE